MATLNDHTAEEPATDPAPPSAPRQPERFRLWRRMAPMVWMWVAGFLPCPDLVTRYRVRAAARNLVTCEAWSDDDAKGADVAQLAMLRLLWLQKETHRAVRGRHPDAAAMLARASVETLILGLYCLHWEGVVEELTAANIKALRDALYYLAESGTDIAPREVIDQCIAAIGEPRRGPTVWTMAERVDEAMKGDDVRSLYRRLYIPTSNFTVHASAGSLLRHVGPGGKLRRRPGRAGARRAPARVADACMGVLATALAADADKRSTRFARYARRHLDRTLLPLVFMILSNATRSTKLRSFPRKLKNSLTIIRDVGTYLWSGQAAQDPVGVRTARIRAGIEDALHVPEIEVQPGALDPLLDYVATKVATEALGEAHGTLAT